MVPSVFVLLDVLPLTPNGKVDRRVLPIPDQSRPDLENFFVAPRTEVEEILAQIWTDVLNLEKVGIHDNFFDLGGHSILATQVLSRVRGVFRMELPLRILFDNRTVRELANAITKLRGESVISEEIAATLRAIESLSEEETVGLLVK
jgi:acyl carrier protein